MFVWQYHIDAGWTIIYSDSIAFVIAIRPRRKSSSGRVGAHPKSRCSSKKEAQ